MDLPRFGWSPVPRREFFKVAMAAAGAWAVPAWLQAQPTDPVQGRLTIRRVDPYVVRIGRRENVVCVRVETDDGIHGWGEGTSPPTVAAVVAQLRSLGDLVMGESAWDIERIWRRMYTREENTLGGTLYAAISAIDTALWDIVGKRLGVPVYKLLGGKVHDPLRIYASYRWGDIPRTAEAYETRTRELMAEGRPPANTTRSVPTPALTGSCRPPR